MLGDEFPDFLESYQAPRQFALRVNTAKITTEKFLELSPFHLTPVPWIENGFFYSSQDRPSRHPYYQTGLYYLQEPSAMTPASRLPVHREIESWIYVPLQEEKLQNLAAA